MIGQLPTIADIRALGMTGFALDCLGLHCHHHARIEFDALRLPDDLILIEIPKARRFVCAKCGGRAVTVRPDWLQYEAAGAPRRFPSRGEGARTPGEGADAQG